MAQLLGVDVQQRDGWVVVALRGQLDVATAPDFRQRLLELQFGPTPRVVIDLDGVEFLDSLGLGVLVGALKRARTHGGELVLVCTRARIRHLLDLTRLSEVVRVVSSVDEALGVPGTVQD